MSSEVIIAIIAGVFLYIAAGVLVITAIALVVAIIVEVYKWFK